MNVESIRSDFPLLQRSVNGKPLVYLDSGATAQKPERVIEAINRMHREHNANIHRGVHRLSAEATDLYEQARERVRTFIGAASRKEIIFTAGATASINTVAYAWSERFLREGDNIVISEMEHHSNIVPWQIVAERRGAQIRVLPFDEDGSLRVDMLDTLFDERTRMVALTQASNTLGTRPCLRPIIERAHSLGAHVLIDGCQGVVHGGVDVKALDCDFYAFSGHKLYGPTGIGVLYGKRELLEQMPPFLSGGDMVDRVSFEKTTYAPLPLKYEAGTANFVGAIGLGEAIEYLQGLDLASVEEHERELMRYAERGLQQIEGLRIYGTTEDKCSIISFNVERVHHYDLGMILDKLGVAIRTGQHCAEPVMTHYGVTGMCRASLAMYNTREEMDVFVAGVVRAVRMLR